jgi:hypothetical protein
MTSFWHVLLILGEVSRQLGPNRCAKLIILQVTAVDLKNERIDMLYSIRANRPHPWAINTDEHAGYPQAVVQLKAEGALKETCRHRPVQYLTTSWKDHPAIKRQVRASQFSFILGRLAYDLRLRGDSYDPLRPSVLDCGGCEGWSTAAVYSRSVRGGELNCRSSTPDVCLDYELAKLPCGPH